MVNSEHQHEFESGLGRAPLLSNQFMFVCYLFLVGWLCVYNASLTPSWHVMDNVMKHLIQGDGEFVVEAMKNFFYSDLYMSQQFAARSIPSLILVMIANLFVLTRVFTLTRRYSIDNGCTWMVRFFSLLIYLPSSLILSSIFQKSFDIATGAICSILALFSVKKVAVPIGFIITKQVDAFWNTGGFECPVTVMDIASSGGALALIVVLVALFYLHVRAVLFPKSTIRRGKDGIALGAWGWRWLLGEKLVPWEDLQLVSIIRERSQKFIQFKIKNKDFKISWAEMTKYFEPAQLMSDLKTHAANAVDASCNVADDSSKFEYTELWLKYFTTATARDRTGMLQAGEKLQKGRYEVAGELGQGGQGTAYLASSNGADENIDEGTTIVLKEYILPVHRGEAIFQHSIQKLQHEASILGKIDHPNIVSLKDTFIEDHRGYLVLEYVEGRGLKQIVQEEGAQPEKLVIDIAIQVCGVLEHLHGMDPPVIHRDLTPDNLILQPSGKIKLVDFNVAHQLEANSSATVVGKHAYIPPEQFRGKPSHQSDIFALGGTLFYLLTGQDPEPLSVSHPNLVNAEVSDALDQIVATATKLEAKDRYADAEQMREALSSLLKD